MISNQLPLRLCRFGTSILLGCLFVLTAFAKNSDDVVVLKNGDRLTGEIKGLQRGELRIKADYMAEPFGLIGPRLKQLKANQLF
jgi:hypothetical protein